MRYFTADTHFDHDKALEFMPRPFRNVRDMNECMLQEIAKTCTPQDELVIIGDVSFSNIEEWGKIRRQIHVKKLWLIWGNHDRLGYGDLFDETFDSYVFTLEHPEFGQHKAYCLHYPCAIWPGSHRGDMQLYGHCHGQREQWLDEIMPDRRSMDVGVDNAYRLLGAFRPFSEAEIVDLLLYRTGHHRPDEIEENVRKLWKAEYDPLLQNAAGRECCPPPRGSAAPVRERYSS